MKFSEEFNSGDHFIRGYDSQGVTIGDQHYRDNLIVSRRKIEPWLIEAISELNCAALAPLLQHKPEVIVLGTGRKQQFPPLEILAYCSQQGVGLEVMSNSAACRTYNILLSEERDVIAALLLSDGL